MKLCDWCGESLPDDSNDFLTLKGANWPYSNCRNRKIETELHDECYGALLGILREGDRQRPAPLAIKQTLFRRAMR